jgi:hypothetical protein
MSKNGYKALEAIEILVGEDFGLDMEYATLEKNPRKLVSRLREAGKVITQIYQIVHAENSHACSHPSWERLKDQIIAKNAQENLSA